MLTQSMKTLLILIGIFALISIVAKASYNLGVSDTKIEQLLSNNQNK
jgi:hypothetical protein